MEEHSHMYPVPSAELSRKRRELAPDIERAFHEFGRQVFAAGALDTKTKQLVAEKGRPSRRSWRRYGSPRRCARAAHMPIL